MVIWPPNEVFWKFLLNFFYWSIVLYHAIKFETNPSSKSLDIDFHNLGHNLLKIVHLAKKMIYLEISHKWFLSTYSALSCSKVWKNSLRGSCNIKLHSFEPHLDKNCSFSLKENFLTNFTPVIFLYLLFLIKLRSLGKALTVETVM